MADGTPPPAIRGDPPATTPPPLTAPVVELSADQIVKIAEAAAAIIAKGSTKPGDNGGEFRGIIASSFVYGRGGLSCATWLSGLADLVPQLAKDKLAGGQLMGSRYRGEISRE